MDLFEQQRRDQRAGAAPLAVRMRPACLEEFVGQEHFLGEGRLLRRLIEADRLASAIFYGAPGTGKTTLAHVIAGLTGAHFVSLNAVASGVRELRETLLAARERLETGGQRSILFIDELHRFNRAQQDVLLGDVEDGIIILIGATTENPFFAVNAPLISRSQIFQFEPLTENHLRTLITRALNDRQRGLGTLQVRLDEDAAVHLARFADGDARRALTALEIAVRSQQARLAADEVAPNSSTAIHVDLSVVADSIQRKALRYDRDGDGHYDCISALIKSMRGSDPDAAVYWLARMLESGEDPRFIARRIVIFAAEDVGNADPRGLLIAQAAADATVLTGPPECQLPLAQAAIYLACTAKSRACAEAIAAARDDVRRAVTRVVPPAMRDGHYQGHERLSASSNAETATDTEAGTVYYAPGAVGAEAAWRAALAAAREARAAR